jgi:glycosyltransferase involved in cell wall biosynthesis
MKVGLLNSCTNDVLAGTGTSRLVACLRTAISLNGFELREISGPLQSEITRSSLEGRIESNAHMISKLAAESLDLLIGIDFDGYALPESAPPLVSVCAALFADILPHEPIETKDAMRECIRLEGAAFSKAVAVITPSNYARERLRILHGLSLEKIHVLTPFLPHDSWAHAVASRRNPCTFDAATILAVSRLYPRKRIDLLLQAYALLKTMGVTAQLRIIGDGPERNRLEKIAAELEISREVAWLGAISNDQQMIEEWTNATVFCHPSLQECFGFVLLEAMVSGLPVVAFDVATSCEVLGASAHLATVGDVRELALKLNHVLAADGAGRQHAISFRPAAERFDQSLASLQLATILHSSLAASLHR